MDTNSDIGGRITRSLRRRLNSGESESSSRSGTPVLMIKLTPIDETALSSPSQPARVTRRNSTSLATPLKMPTGNNTPRDIRKRRVTRNIKVAVEPEDAPSLNLRNVSATQIQKSPPKVLETTSQPRRKSGPKSKQKIEESSPSPGAFFDVEVDVVETSDEDAMQTENKEEQEQPSSSKINENDYCTNVNTRNTFFTDMEEQNGGTTKTNDINNPPRDSSAKDNNRAQLSKAFPTIEKSNTISLNNSNNTNVNVKSDKELNKSPQQSLEQICENEPISPTLTNSEINATTHELNSTVIDRTILHCHSSVGLDNDSGHSEPSSFSKQSPLSEDLHKTLNDELNSENSNMQKAINISYESLNNSREHNVSVRDVNSLKNKGENVQQLLGKKEEDETSMNESQEYIDFIENSLKHKTSDANITLNKKNSAEDGYNRCKEEDEKEKSVKSTIVKCKLNKTDDNTEFTKSILLRKLNDIDSAKVKDESMQQSISVLKNDLKCEEKSTKNISILLEMKDNVNVTINESEESVASIQINPKKEDSSEKSTISENVTDVDDSTQNKDGNMQQLIAVNNSPMKYKQEQSIKTIEEKDKDGESINKSQELIHSIESPLKGKSDNINSTLNGESVAKNVYNGCKEHDLKDESRNQNSITKFTLNKDDDDDNDFNKSREEESDKKESSDEILKNTDDSKNNSNESISRNQTVHNQKNFIQGEASEVENYESSHSMDTEEYNEMLLNESHIDYESIAGDSIVDDDSEKEDLSSFIDDNDDLINEEPYRKYKRIKCGTDYSSDSSVSINKNNKVNVRGADEQTIGEQSKNSEDITEHEMEEEDQLQKRTSSIFKDGESDAEATSKCELQSVPLKAINLQDKVLIKSNNEDNDADQICVKVSLNVKGMKTTYMEKKDNEKLSVSFPGRTKTHKRKDRFSLSFTRNEKERINPHGLRQTDNSNGKPKQNVLEINDNFDKSLGSNPPQVCTTNLNKTKNDNEISKPNESDTNKGPQEPTITKLETSAKDKNSHENKPIKLLDEVLEYSKLHKMKIQVEKDKTERNNIKGKKGTTLKESSSSENEVKEEQQLQKTTSTFENEESVEATSKCELESVQLKAINSQDKALNESSNEDNGADQICGKISPNQDCLKTEHMKTKGNEKLSVSFSGPTTTHKRKNRFSLSFTRSEKERINPLGLRQTDNSDGKHKQNVLEIDDNFDKSLGSNPPQVCSTNLNKTKNDNEISKHNESDTNKGPQESTLTKLEASAKDKNSSENKPIKLLDEVLEYSKLQKIKVEVEKDKTERDNIKGKKASTLKEPSSNENGVKEEQQLQKATSTFENEESVVKATSKCEIESVQLKAINPKDKALKESSNEDNDADQICGKISPNQDCLETEHTKTTRNVELSEPFSGPTKAVKRKNRSSVSFTRNEPRVKPISSPESNPFQAYTTGLNKTKNDNKKSESERDINNGPQQPKIQLETSVKQENSSDKIKKILDRCTEMLEYSKLRKKQEQQAYEKDKKKKNNIKTKRGTNLKEPSSTDVVGESEKPRQIFSTQEFKSYISSKRSRMESSSDESVNYQRNERTVKHLPDKIIEVLAKQKVKNEKKQKALKKLSVSEFEEGTQKRRLKTFNAADAVIETSLMPAKKGKVKSITSLPEPMLDETITPPKSTVNPKKRRIPLTDFSDSELREFKKRGILIKTNAAGIVFERSPTPVKKVKSKTIMTLSGPMLVEPITSEHVPEGLIGRSSSKREVFKNKVTTYFNAAGKVVETSPSPIKKKKSLTKSLEPNTKIFSKHSKNIKVSRRQVKHSATNITKVNTLPKPQWNGAGFYIEEPLETQVIQNTGGTKFLVSSLAKQRKIKKSKIDESKQQVNINSNFKGSAQKRADIKRTPAREVILRKMIHE